MLLHHFTKRKKVLQIFDWPETFFTFFLPLEFVLILQSELFTESWNHRGWERNIAWLFFFFVHSTRCLQGGLERLGQVKYPGNALNTCRTQLQKTLPGGTEEEGRNAWLWSSSFTFVTFSSVSVVHSAFWVQEGEATSFWTCNFFKNIISTGDRYLLEGLTTACKKCLSLVVKDALLVLAHYKNKVLCFNRTIISPTASKQNQAALGRSKGFVVL